MTVAAAMACLTGVGSASAAVGDLSYSGCWGSPNAPIGPVGCSAAVGLSGADGVAVSPDGTSVYVAGATSNGLAVLHRASDGQLTYLQCWGNPDAGTGLGPAGCQPALGLGEAASVAVSPDGTSVYVAGIESDGLAAFHRNADGTLTNAGCIGNPDTGTGLGPVGCIPALGLGGAFSVAVSPDGTSVYVTGVLSNGLAVLHRAADGSLTYVGCVGNPDLSTGIGPAGCTPAPGLGGADSVAVSPDGTSVYVTGFSSSAISVLHRAADGTLTYAGCMGNPDGTTGLGPAGCQPALGLGGAISVAVSPDGTSVYATGVDSNGIAVLHRAADGELTYTGCVGNPDAGTGLGPAGCQPALGLGGADSVTVSPDGASVYATGPSSNGIAVLHRAANGDLTYTGCLGNPDASTGIGPAGCTPALGLGGAERVAVSPDGTSAYATGANSNALTVLNRVPSPSSGGGSGGSGGSGGGQSGSGGSLPTTTTTATVGNRRVTFSSTTPTGCLAHSARLKAIFSAAAIIGSTARPLTFVKAEFYIDRGVRHVHHHRLRRHGRIVSVKTVSYTPNQIMRSLPANLSVSVAKLRPGTHTLRIRAVFHTTSHGHTRTVNKTLIHRFTVCKK